MAMAWETRGGAGARYYYRSQRTGAHVTKRYYGCGMLAQRAAQQDAEAKARSAAERGALRSLQASLAEPDRRISDLDDVVTLLFEGTLLAAGFGRDNYGPWRKRHARQG